jgi:hypothetical protein
MSDGRVCTKWHKSARLLVAGAACFGIAACYTDYPTGSAYNASIITAYSKTAAFGSFKTFALADSVVYLSTSTISGVSTAYNATILSTIAANMASLGYTEVNNPKSADVVLIPAVTTSTTSGYASYGYGSYWGWYGYYPSASYYYPSYSVPYSYTTGTLLVGMIDNNAVTTTTLPIIWVGASVGLLSSSTVTAASIPTSINAMFTASPYLRAQ